MPRKIKPIGSAKVAEMEALSGQMTVPIEINAIFRKLTKKHDTTKVKAAEELIVLLKSMSSDDLKTVLPHWSTIYNIISIDSDKRLRLLINIANGIICSVDLKNDIVPFLNNFMACWLLSLFDPAIEVKKSATDSFKKKVETFSDLKYISQSDAEFRYSRAVSGCFYSLSFICELGLDNISVGLNSLFKEPSFWSKSSYPSSMIRISFYKFLTSAVINCRSVLEPFLESICSSFFVNSFKESDPSTHQELWNAILNTIKAWPSKIWEISDKKVFMNLLSFLNNAAYGSTKISYPSFVVVLSSIPLDTLLVKNNPFHPKFFDSFWKGIGHESIVPMNFKLFISSYMECLYYHVRKAGNSAQNCLEESFDRVVEAYLFTFKYNELGSKLVLTDLCDEISEYIVKFYLLDSSKEYINVLLDRIVDMLINNRTFDGSRIPDDGLSSVYRSLSFLLDCLYTTTDVPLALEEKFSDIQKKIINFVMSKFSDSINQAPPPGIYFLLSTILLRNEDLADDIGSIIKNQITNIQKIEIGNIKPVLDIVHVILSRGNDLSQCIYSDFLDATTSIETICLLFEKIKSQNYSFNFKNTNVENLVIGLFMDRLPSSFIETSVATNAICLGAVSEDGFQKVFSCLNLEIEKFTKDIYNSVTNDYDVELEKLDFTISFLTRIFDSLPMSRTLCKCFNEIFKLFVATKYADLQGMMRESKDSSLTKFFAYVCSNQELQCIITIILKEHMELFHDGTLDPIIFFVRISIVIKYLKADVKFNIHKLIGGPDDWEIIRSPHYYAHPSASLFCGFYPTSGFNFNPSSNYNTHHYFLVIQVMVMFVKNFEEYHFPFIIKELLLARVLLHNSIVLNDGKYNYAELDELCDDVDCILVKICQSFDDEIDQYMSLFRGVESVEFNSNIGKCIKELYPIASGGDYICANAIGKACKILFWNSRCISKQFSFPLRSEINVCDVVFLSALKSYVELTDIINECFKEMKIEYLSLLSFLWTKASYESSISFIDWMMINYERIEDDNLIFGIQIVAKIIPTLNNPCLGLAIKLCEKSLFGNNVFLKYAGLILFSVLISNEKVKEKEEFEKFNLSCSELILNEFLAVKDVKNLIGKPLNSFQRLLTKLVFSIPREIIRRRWPYDEVLLLLEMENENLLKGSYVILKNLAAEQAKAFQEAYFAVESCDFHDEENTPKLPDSLITLLKTGLCKEVCQKKVHIFGRLLSWKILFDNLETIFKNDYVRHLKETNIIDNFFSLVMSILDVSGKPIDVSKIQFSQFDIESFDLDSKMAIPALAAHLYWTALGNIPSVCRAWYNDECPKKFITSLDMYTSKYFSPNLISEQFECLNNVKVGSMDIKISRSSFSNEVDVFYKVDESQMEMKVVLPNNYPLRIVEVVGIKRVGVTEERFRRWLLNCNSIMAAQNGSILEAIQVLEQNITKHFEGIEDCAICYSVIGVLDKSIPNKKCKTCKNKFHSGCLMKWFKTSNNSTCPLCRNLF